MKNLVQQILMGLGLQLSRRCYDVPPLTVTRDLCRLHHTKQNQQPTNLTRWQPPPFRFCGGIASGGVAVESTKGPRRWLLVALLSMTADWNRRDFSSSIAGTHKR